MTFSSSWCAVISVIAAGRLVDLAALDADEPVLDQVDPADTLGAGAPVELGDDLLGADGRPSSAVGTPSAKVMITSSASRGCAGSEV